MIIIISELLILGGRLVQHFIQYIIRVASGERVNNEKKNYREIAIFKTGLML
jgi:altronate dehydratase